MLRDSWTFLSFAALILAAYLGYKNWGQTDSKMEPLTSKSCEYSPNFITLDELEGKTPIVYSLQNHQIWKGQSGAGPFLRVSPEKDKILGFRIFGSHDYQALTQNSSEYTVMETKDGGELWKVVSTYNESEITGHPLDAVEFQNRIFVVSKVIGAGRPVIMIWSREENAKWQLERDLEAQATTAAALGKDTNGNLFLAYSVNDKLVLEKRNPDTSFTPAFEFYLPKGQVFSNNSLNVLADHNDNIRVMVNYKQNSKQRSGVVTFYLDGTESKLEDLSVEILSTHMSVSEDGTIALDGKASAGAETFLRISLCN